MDQTSIAIRSEPPYSMIDMNQLLYFPDSYQNRGENEKDIAGGNVLFKDFENTKALLC